MISWVALWLQPLCRLRSTLRSGSRDLGALSLFSKPVAAIGLLTPCPDAVCMESSARLSVPLPISKCCALSGTDGRAFISPELCQKSKFTHWVLGACHPACCRMQVAEWDVFLWGGVCFRKCLLSHLLRSTAANSKHKRSEFCQ